MMTSIDATKPIERLTRASLDPWRPVQALVRGVRDLHELEQKGESEWTPFVAIAGLVIFLGCVFLFMVALAEAASRGV
jgi:hypothetical protein